MSRYPITPQLQNAWVCTLCGAEYPSERERDLHMLSDCEDSPIPRIEEMQRQRTRRRAPITKAKTFSHSREHRKLYSPTQPWDQPSSLRGYAPPPVQQDTEHSRYTNRRNRGKSLPKEPQEGARFMSPKRPSHSTVPAQPSSLTGFGDGAASEQKNRRVSDSQERQTHFGHNIPPNDISPLAKVNSPLAPSEDKAEVTFIWKKEIPTLEREVSYIDNIQEPVTLAWRDEKEFFQGNAIFSQGIHTGSILFPTSGEMQAVQPFEVEKKGMEIVALKLAESPIKSEPSELPTPSSIPKPTNESEEAKSVPPIDKEEKGMKEQLLKQNQELKDKEEKIRKMREEMDCLNKTIDTVKEDKQKVKKEMVKLDEQLIKVMTEMSSIRIHGSSEGQKLEKENKSLKNQLELLQHREPIGGDELLAKAKVTIIWKNEIPTLEKEVTYIDNTQERITLAWSDSKEFFQGNTTLGQGIHMGIIFFPTSGELEEVQPFEVKKKWMTISIVTLKLVDMKSPKLEPSKDQIQLLQYKDEVVSGEKEISELRKQIQENKQAKEELENNIKTLNEDLEQQKNACEDLRGELKILKKDLERNNNDFEEISMESTIGKDKIQDKYFKMEREKQDLRKQIDGFHTLIIAIKENESNLKFKLNDSEKEKEKMRTENAKLEKELGKTVDLEKMKKDIETIKIEQLEKELKSERESSTIQKQLIGKLINENQTGEEAVTKLKEELELANKYKNSLEYKLEQMSQEKTDRDSEILPYSTKQVNKQVLGPIYNNVELGKLTTIYSKYQLESEDHQND